MNTNKTKNKISPFHYIKTLLQGFLMGVSNVIPGISGGTIALVIGIYGKFIHVLNDISKWVSSFLKFLFGFKKEKWNISKENFKLIDWLWIIILMVGRGIAILLISSFMKYLLDNYPAQIYGAFFGFILASVIVPLEKMEKKHTKEAIAFVVGFVFLFWFSGLEAFETTVQPQLWLLLLSGIIATSAMILPGISGSFLLVILGVHSYIFGLAPLILKGELFTTTVLTPLILYGVGWLIGILSFSRVINILLKKYHSITMGFLVGLMLGSLRKIYPFLNMSGIEKGTSIDDIPKIMFWEMDTKYLSSMDFISIILCIIAGIVLVISFHFIAKNITKKSSKNTYG